MVGVEGNILIAKAAIGYTRSAISTAYPMGSGHGPLNHSHLTTRRALPEPTKSNPHPFVSHLIQSDLPLWKSYVRRLPNIGPAADDRSDTHSWSSLEKGRYLRNASSII